MKRKKIIICGNGDSRLYDETLSNYPDCEVVGYAFVSKDAEAVRLGDTPIVDLCELKSFEIDKIVVSVRHGALDVFLLLTTRFGVAAQTIEMEVWNSVKNRFVKPESRKFSMTSKRKTTIDSTSPNYFLVASSGRSGARWFASSLHRHPEIACSAGVDHPWDSFRHRYNQSELNAILDLVYEDPTSFASGIPLARYLKEKLEAKNIDTCVPVRDFARVGEFILNELEFLHDRNIFGSAKALGNVHGTMCYELAATIDNATNAFDGKTPVIAHLVRHPVTRFESRVTAHVQHLERGYLGPDEMAKINKFVSENASTILKMEKEHKIEFTLKDKVFMWFSKQIDVQRHWAFEVVAYDVKHLLFERLKTDPDYFGWAIDYLTRSSVTVDDDYLNFVFSKENLLGGRGDAKFDQKPSPLEPLEQYDAWSSWQRHEFDSIARKYDLHNVYGRIGYDLSFIS